MHLTGIEHHNFARGAAVVLATAEKILSSRERNAERILLMGMLAISKVAHRRLQQGDLIQMPALLVYEVIILCHASTLPSSYVEICDDSRIEKAFAKHLDKIAELLFRYRLSIHIF